MKGGSRMRGSSLFVKTPSASRSFGTVSRGRARASVRKCPEQWRISKFAGGKEPTGLFARMRLLTLDEGGKGFSAHIPLAPSPRELSPKVTEGVALL